MDVQHCCRLAPRRLDVAQVCVFSCAGRVVACARRGAILQTHHYAALLPMHNWTARDVAALYSEPAQPYRPASLSGVQSY